jgi:hypothetical protein
VIPDIGRTFVAPFPTRAAEENSPAEPEDE